jgi:hypothetical protein
MKNILAKLLLFGLTFLMYLTAVLCALFLSFFILPGSLMIVGLPFNLIFVTIGFIGVFLPSFILPRQSRVGCAIFLTLLISYCNSIAYTWDLSLVPPMPKTLKTAFYLLSPFFGGLIAIGVHYFLARQKKHDGKP